jgi:hypothetical protein
VISHSLYIAAKIAERLFKVLEKKLNLSAALKYALLEKCIKIYYSVVESILKYYWRVLNAILNKYPLSIISLICFQLNRGEIGKLHYLVKEPSEKFKNQKRFLVRPETIHFSKKLNSFS